MSAGGSSLLSIACRRVAAGTRTTVVPSARVTWRRVKVGSLPLLRADATTPPTRMSTASPRTTRAGPRTDIGS